MIEFENGDGPGSGSGSGSASGSALEGECRAMFGDRSEDVPLSAAPYAALARRIAVARRQRRQRLSGAVLATVVTVAGAGAFAASSTRGTAVPTGPRPSEPATPGVSATSTKFVYDDGQTVFSATGAAPASLGGYIGYLRDGATTYLATVHADDPSNKYTDVRTLENGGYTIATTFNEYAMDDAVTAADALWKNQGWNPTKHASDHDVHLAFAAVDPRTGYVKAVYNGVDGVQDYSKAKVDAALTGGVQVGSLFKPFTLAAAFQTGKFTPDSMEPASNVDKPLYDPAGSTDQRDRLTYVDANGRVQNWPPSEDGEGSHGSVEVSLRFGMEQSYNAVFANLEMDQNVGLDNVYDMATKLGIAKHTVGFSRVPSLTLGTAEVTPAVMASAFGTFAAGGVHHAPVTVSEIRDRNGKVVWKAPAEGVVAMSPSAAAQVTDVLKGVLARGTASGNVYATDLARKLPELAGKTSTTDSDHAAWFDGYDSKLATAVAIFRQTPSGTFEPLTGVASDDPLQRINGMSSPTDVWAKFTSIAEPQ